MSRNLFITGTGTDIGKTYVAGLIVKKLNENGRKAAYYKAAMSGNERREDGSLIPGDALHVKNVSGIGQSLESMCPFVYEAAVSPHLASKIEGNHVDMDVVSDGYRSLCEEYEYVTVEGSGGIICPLRYDGERLQLEDVIKAGNMSSLMIADAGLGTINGVVLTAEYMKARNLLVQGIIFNNFEPGNTMHEDNKYMCEELTGLKVIACVKAGDTDLDISAQALEELYV